VIGSDASPFIDWWVAVWAAGRVGDPRLTPVLLTGASAEDPYIRALAARGLGTLKDPSHLGTIRRLAEDREPSVVREALRACVPIGGAGAAAIASAHLDSPKLLVRREALLALASLPPSAALRARVIENVGHPDPWVRAAAWPALIRIDAEDVGLVLSTIGPDTDWRVRRSVATALGENLGERAAPLLLPMLNDEDVRVIPAVLEALARARGGDAAATLLDHVTHADMAVRAAAVRGLSSLLAGEPRLAAALNRAFEASLSDKDVETRVHIVEAASRKPDAPSLELLRRIAGSDPTRAVRQEAMSRLGDGRAAPEPTAIRMAEARRLVSVYEPGAEPRYSPRVIISTRRGDIEIVLDLVEAPLSSLSFVRLAESGFFNGLTFHRVVPGYATQAGDPRGDGHGGPGFTVRCEYSGRPFGRGAVGMATTGKDTGGSQFFIAVEPQPDLDGAYTQFGQVLSGLDVVEKLRPGDVILRVDVFDGRGEP
jgi:cyclophilin family peptidyl-prolyl cis-trans isomerase/HEAT repeat protein